MTMASPMSLTKGSAYPALGKDKLRVYSMRFCPYAERTRLVLAHKKIPYETVNIQLKQKPEWYFDKNPLGLVPTLERGDKIVYDSAIVNDYLDEIYPTNKLNPSDPYEKARQRILMERFSSVITQFYKLYRLEIPEDEKNAILNDIEKGLKVVENELKGTFFGGKTVSMADLHMWPWFERFGMFQSMTSVDVLPKATFPKLNAWITAMQATDAVKACAFSTDLHYKFIKSHFDGKPNYDLGL